MVGVECQLVICRGHITPKIDEIAVSKRASKNEAHLQLFVMT